MSRTIARAAGAVVAAVLMAAGSAASAQAGSFPHDGHRAYQDGCRADQQVIFHKLIKDGSGTAVGYVDLMYSVHCHTAWAHVHSVHVQQNQTWVTHGRITRNYDGVHYGCSGTEGGHDCYTKMVYDKGMTSYAWGEVDPNGCCGQPYDARTSSY